CVFVHHRAMAPEGVREVVAEVHTSYPMRATDLSLAILAAVSRYSRAHFLRMFRASTAQTPHQWADVRQKFVRYRSRFCELLPLQTSTTRMISFECSSFE